MTISSLIRFVFSQLSRTSSILSVMQEIKDATLIEEADLKRNLQSLACAKFKVLRKHPPGRDINNDDSFSFNTDFSAPMQRIKISTVSSKPETIQERKETQDKIDEERKHQIDVRAILHRSIS